MDKKKILIVEDERIIAEDLRHTLQRLGYKVVGIAASGTEALKIAREEIPNLALMDIVLRGKLDGITVAQRLKDKFDVPSIYLTAYADKQILKRAKITAPYGYIIKPFDEKELHTNIEIALERNKSHRIVHRTNVVLRAVRDVNQLIVRERNPRKLIRETCKILTRGRGYIRAWIVLLDGEGNLTHSAQSGWGKKFQLLLQMIKKGEIPECGKKAMTQKEVVVSKGSVSCRNCPFHEFYPEYYNLTIALVSHGWTQGLMSVALPERTLVEEPELNLFRELAGDVAFGLRDLELEDQRRQMNTALQESEARFRVLSESAAEAIAIHDKGVILDVNSIYCEMFGYDQEEVIGMNVLDFAAPESKDLVLKNVKRGYQKPYEAVGLRKDGSTFIGELIGKPIPYKGRTVRATVIRDITDRKRMERTLQLIVEGTSATTGVNFFRDLVRSIARVLETDIAFITRRDPTNPQLVRTLALWQNGQIRENIEWEIEGTPCELVIKGKSVVIPRNVQQKFPKDTMLKEVNAEGYLAVPIRDADENVVGHLGTLDSKPLEYPEKLENIMQIFAIRAGTELQRLQSEEELGSVFASNPLPILTLDEDRIVQNSNAAAQEYCQMVAEEIAGQRVGDVLLCLHRLDDPKGCGFGPDCEHCITRNTVLDTFFDKQTRQGIESEMSLLVDGEPTSRTIRLNTSYFDSLLGPRVMVMFDDITEQKQNRDEILRLKEFNENIITGMAEGIVVMDAEGIMEYVNPAVVGMLGYSRKELEGQHWSLIIPEDQHPIVNAVDERRKQGESSVYDLQLVRKDGQRLDVRVSGSPRFQNSEFVGTMAVFTDITEQKRTDKALRESEEKFKSIFESFIDVYYRQDKDRLITMVSPSIRQFGYKPEDIIGTRGRDYYYDQADREELVALLEKEGIIKDYRVKLRDARGNPVWTSANLRMLRDLKGNFAGIEGVLRDITKRKQAEEALRDSEERYRNILESIEEGYYEVDLKGNFTFFNDSLCKMLDYSRDELMGMNNRKYMDAESATRVYKAFNRVYKTGKPTKSIEIKIKKNTGEVKFGEISVSLLRDKDNQPIGFRGIVRDITDRRQAEDQLRASEAFNRTVLSSISEGFVVLDREFHYVVWNHFMETITGLKASEVLGKKPFNLFPFIKEHNLDKLLKRALDGEEVVSPDFKYSIPGTGREGWAISTYAPHRNSDGAIIGVVVLVRDITERKRAERDIRRSEENLRNLFRFTTDAIVIQNKQREILDCNQAVVELFGYTRDELLNDPTIQLYDPEKTDETKRVEYLEQAFQGNPQHFEWWGRRKDGSIFPEEILLNRTIYNGEVVVFVTVRDITERKNAEEALAESEEKFRTLVENAPTGILTIDTKGNITQVNQKLLEILGSPSKEETMKINILKFKPLEKAGATAGFRKVLETSEAVQLEHEYTSKWGKTSYLRYMVVPIRDENGNIIGAQANIEDATEEWRAQQEIATLADALKSIHEFVSITDKEDKLIFVNEAFLKAYGYTREEVIGRNVREIVGSDKNPPEVVKEILPATMRGGWQGELINRRKDGSEFPVSLSTSPIKNEAGEVVALIGVAEDITEQKAAQEQLLQSEKSFRGLYDNASDAIYIQDREGKFMDVNKGAVKMYGYPKSFFIGKTPEPLSAPGKNDMKQVAKYIERAFKGEPQEFEFWGRRKNGEIFPKIVRLTKGVYFGQEVVIAFASDITERKRAEEEIKARAEELARFNKLMVGRELKMVELKREVNELLKKAGLPKKYKTPETVD